MIAPARIRSRPRSRQQREAHAEAGQDEGELADLREARRDGQRRATSDSRTARTIRKAATDLPTTMISSVASSGSGSRSTIVGSNSMPTETKNSTAKASRSGSVSSAARWLSSRLAQDHAGEEGAERERHVEQRAGAEGDAERDREHGQAEQLARARVRHAVQHPGNDPLADHQHDRDEGRHLAERRAATGSASAPAPAPRSCPCRMPGQRRQQHQRQDHHEVLDDQPADGDAAALGLDQPPLLQRAQQHDRAGHRQREAEHEARPRSTSRAARPGPCRAAVATAICAIAPGMAMRAHRQQVLEREMQADAEHQQDDADLGQLVGEALVGDEARREGPDQHAGQQIADQRRDAQAVGERAEDEGQHQPHDDGRDQRRVVVHLRDLLTRRDRPLLAKLSIPTRSSSATKANAHGQDHD